MSNEQFFGLLPYGTDDPSVLFRSPLTSKAQLVADAATYSTTLTTIDDESTFDEVLGMSQSIATERGYSLTSIPNAADFQNGGQVYCEVQKGFFTQLDATTGSVGTDMLAYDGSGNPCLFGLKTSSNDYLGPGVKHTSVVAKWPFIYLNSSTISATQYEKYMDNIPTDTTSGAAYLHSAAHDDFLKLHLIFLPVGGDEFDMILVIDGEIVFKTTSLNLAGTLLTTFYLGSILGSGNYNNRYDSIRNIQIASRVPAFGVCANIGKTMYHSDSMLGGGTKNYPTPNLSLRYLAPNTNFGSCMYDSEVSRIISNSDTGLLPTEHRLIANTGYGLVGGSSQFSSTVADILAEYPRTVITHYGTNDLDGIIAATFTATQWATEYKSVLTTMFDAGVENVIVCTIPSPKYDSTYLDTTGKAAWDSLNVEIEALPAWAAANHADKTLLIAPVESYLGGWESNALYYEGGFSGANDNVHYWALGNLLCGRAIGHTMLKLLK